MKRTLLLALLLGCLKSFATINQEQLYDAYLQNDMTPWQTAIAESNWETLSATEKKQLLNYEYGYVAYILSVEGKEKEAKESLKQFEAHTEAATDVLDMSTLLCYRSAVAAYSINFNRWKTLSFAKTAFANAEKAVETDSLNPIALTLKANMDMYCPKAFGGDKKRALAYFLRAEKRYQELHQTKQNWNYRALQLCIAQCHEYMGNKDLALQKSQQILQEEPNFTYIKEVYIPHLEGKETKGKRAVSQGEKLSGGL